MWLKDLLPRDVKGIRIMSYGYNTNLVGYTVDDVFLDYRRDFIHMLVNSRSSAEVCKPLSSACASVLRVNSTRRGPGQSYSSGTVWVVS
jgi:hypothetical protein